MATSSAQVNITVQLAVSGDTVGATAGTGINPRTVVSGAFTLTITYAEEVNGLTSSTISTNPSGAASVTTSPTKSASDAKIWTATITPSTAGNFQLTVGISGITPASGSNSVNDPVTIHLYYDGPPDVFCCNQCSLWSGKHVYLDRPRYLERHRYQHEYNQLCHYGWRR